ncbi:MAG: glycosyl hydrolase, partial [Caulobacter sp.]|nr:glycosyl hydrolase [Caulobacter sp.]
MKASSLKAGMTALISAAALLSATPTLAAPVAAPHVVTAPAVTAFPLIVGGKPARVLADPTDFPGVLRVVGDLRSDLAKVAGRGTAPGHDGPTIYVGVIGRNAVIDGLIKAGKLDVGGVTGQWEGFV